MIPERLILTHGEGKGYVIPSGPLNLVFVVTDTGFLGCGAFDVLAMDRFGYPAARVRSKQGDVIADLEDLLEGVIKEANRNASDRGIQAGMPVKDALALL